MMSPGGTATRNENLPNQSQLREANANAKEMAHAAVDEMFFKIEQGSVSGACGIRFPVQRGRAGRMRTIIESDYT